MTSFLLLMSFIDSLGFPNTAQIQCIQIRSRSKIAGIRLTNLFYNYSLLFYKLLKKFLKVETYEHVAKREQVRLERDRSQRNNCTHELTTLGQRIIAVETMVSMLHFDTTTDVMNKIREAQTNLRSANKSVQRIGSNNYLSLVQNAKLSVVSL